jgi:hypothetical protein
VTPVPTPAVSASVARFLRDAIVTVLTIGLLVVAFHRLDGGDVPAAHGAGTNPAGAVAGLP